MMTTPLRIILADDHPLVREGIRTALRANDGLLVVDEAADGETVQHLVVELKPDIVILDISMPGPDAIEIVQYIQAHSPSTSVLILSAYDDDAYVRGLMGAGVAGYVLKDEATEVVIRAVQTVATGGTWLSRSVADKLVHWQNHSCSIEPLTEREQQVLKLLVAGKTNYEIGITMGLAEKTIANSLTSIFDKLGVGSRVEAAVLAVQQQLV